MTPRRANAVSLTVTILVLWLWAGYSARTFGEDVTKLALEHDYSGIGAARAEYQLLVFLLPLFGIVIYGLVRLALWALRHALRRLGLDERTKQPGVVTRLCAGEAMDGILNPFPCRGPGKHPESKDSHDR
jgi:hypothetical protein